MNKYPLYFLAIACVVPVVASEKDEKAVKLLKGNWGAITANQYKQTAENVNEAVKTAAVAVSPEMAHASAKAFTSGGLEGLSDKEIREKGKALGEGIVTGVIGATGVALQAGGAAAKAKAAAAMTALSGGAVVAAPIVLPFTFAGGVFAYCMSVERQKEYGHCLRTHFDSPSVNEEKMPRRCESPERRAFWWSQKWAGQQKRIFKILKEEGRRPRAAAPGRPYWSNDGPNVMGEGDLNNGK